MADHCHCLPHQFISPQVIDEQVEQLATGAAKALTSLWGGLSGVAKNTVTLVSKVSRPSTTCILMHMWPTPVPSKPGRPVSMMPFARAYASARSEHAVLTRWQLLLDYHPQVEAATKELAKDLVSSSGVSEDVAQLQASVRGVATNVTRIGTRLEKGLEVSWHTCCCCLCPMP